jgi:hypothetical protein
MVRPSLFRVIRFVIISIAVVFILFIVVIFAVFTFQGQKDEATVKNLVKEFSLPAEYRLIDSKYDNQSCLDVCAHTVLTYQSSDGKSIPVGVAQEEAKQLGYVYDGHYYYSKNYQGKSVHITITNAPPDKLFVDISL